MRLHFAWRVAISNAAYGHNPWAAYELQVYVTAHKLFTTCIAHTKPQAVCKLHCQWQTTRYDADIALHPKAQGQSA